MNNFDTVRALVWRMIDSFLHVSTTKTSYQTNGVKAEQETALTRGLKTGCLFISLGPDCSVPWLLLQCDKQASPNLQTGKKSLQNVRSELCTHKTGYYEMHSRPK